MDKKDSAKTWGRTATYSVYEIQTDQFSKNLLRWLFIIELMAFLRNPFNNVFRFSIFCVIFRNVIGYLLKVRETIKRSNEVRKHNENEDAHVLFVGSFSEHKSRRRPPRTRP